MNKFDKLFKKIIFEYAVNDVSAHDDEEILVNDNGVLKRLKLTDYKKYIQNKYESLINNDNGEIQRVDPIEYKDYVILLFRDNSKETQYQYHYFIANKNTEEIIFYHANNFKTEQDAITNAKGYITFQCYKWYPAWVTKKSPDSQNRYWFTIHITDRHMHKPEFTKRDYIIASNSKEAYDLINDKYKNNYDEIYNISE